MSSKDKLLDNAQRRGVREALQALIVGTEELTDWKREVGKNANRVSYKHPLSKRMMVRYDLDMVSDLRLLDANVNMRNNHFGSVFGADGDEVYRRLEEYFPSDASKGYGTHGEYYVPVRDTTDAEKFLEFLKSFLDQRDE